MKKRLIAVLIILSLPLATFLLHQPSEGSESKKAGSEDFSAETFQESSLETTNILLFGIDSGREKYEAIRSDAIMILTIDPAHQKLKLSSIMRDTYVEVADKGKMKINEAYAYGGPELAMRAVNDNFDMSIDSYVTVDFVGLSNIVDALGGVELTIKKKEINEINKYMEEVAEIKKEVPTPLKKEGLQLLNGNQAVAYARIRQVGEGDFERAERQNNVMSALFSKIQDLEPSQYPSLAVRLLPYVKTNLSIVEMVQTTLAVYKLTDFELDWYRFPLYGYCEGKVIDRKWVLSTDLSVTTDHLHQFIYDDVKVTPLKDSF
ncbi:LCP family protein [Alkaliphilus crotonatoxidans]